MKCAFCTVRYYRDEDGTVFRIKSFDSLRRYRVEEMKDDYYILIGTFSRFKKAYKVLSKLVDVGIYMNGYDDFNQEDN